MDEQAADVVALEPVGTRTRQDRHRILLRTVRWRPAAGHRTSPSPAPKHTGGRRHPSGAATTDGRSPGGRNGSARQNAAVSTPRADQLRATGRDVRDALIGLLPTGAALLVASAVLSGLVIRPWWTAFLVAAVLAGADALARPALRVLAGHIGAVAALVSGRQVALLELALLVIPTVPVANLGTTVLTLVIVALVSAVTRWLVGVNDSFYLVADLVRRGRAKRRRAGLPTPGDGQAAHPEGVVVVQIDGLPVPAPAAAIARATCRRGRWVGSAAHRAERWWSRVPSTTPAAQAGLLHGEDAASRPSAVRQAGRAVFVANRPPTPPLVEARLSDGRGLLADGGVACRTCSAGTPRRPHDDEPRRRRGAGPGGAYVRFFARPFVLVRALALTVGEMLKELYQGRQQRLRGSAARSPTRRLRGAPRG